MAAGLSMYYRDGVPITAYGYSTAYNNWEFYMSERGAGWGRVDASGRPPTNAGWNTANRWQPATTVRLGVRLSF